MTSLRSTRGWPSVARALGLETQPCGVEVILSRCCELLPHAEIVVAPSPSRARPMARGRFVAGQVTLFPRAFSDPRTLAHTMLHELAHAGGANEAEAEAAALEILSMSRGSP